MATKSRRKWQRSISPLTLSTADPDEFNCFESMKTASQGRRKYAAPKMVCHVLWVKPMIK